MEAFEIQGVIYSTAATNNAKYEERLSNTTTLQKQFQFEFEEADVKICV